MMYKHVISSVSIIRKTIGRRVNSKLFYSENELENEVSVGCVQGCCMLIRANVFEKIGMFDSNTFLYMEEPILERKLSKTQYKTYYYPNSQICHKGGASTAVLSLDAFIHDACSKYYYCDEYLKKGKFLLSILYYIFLLQYCVTLTIKKQPNKMQRIKNYNNIFKRFITNYKN